MTLLIIVAIVVFFGVLFGLAVDHAPVRVAPRDEDLEPYRATPEAVADNLEFLERDDG